MERIQRASDKAADIKSALTFKDTFMGSMVTIIVILLIIYQFIDLLIVYPYNKCFNIDGDCIKYDKEWFSLPGGIFSNITKPENSCSKPPESKKCSGLGKWKKYDTGDKGYLCEKDATKIFKDAIIGGYNSVEILSYIVLPSLTLLGIGYALLFTRPSYADWIFWVLIATLVYTGITSLTYTTNFDILPPDQPSPLLYITDKLNLSASDELKYSFMARKSDGTECLVEGTMLGGGIHSPNNPPSYSGSCTAKDLPLE